jgi:hypothetical protein
MHPAEKSRLLVLSGWKQIFGRLSVICFMSAHLENVDAVSLCVLLRARGEKEASSKN